MEPEDPTHLYKAVQSLWSARLRANWGEYEIGQKGSLALQTVFLNPGGDRQRPSQGWSDAWPGARGRDGVIVTGGRCAIGCRTSH